MRRAVMTLRNVLYSGYGPAVVVSDSQRGQGARPPAVPDQTTHGTIDRAGDATRVLHLSDSWRLFGLHRWRFHGRSEEAGEVYGE